MSKTFQNKLTEILYDKAPDLTDREHILLAQAITALVKRDIIGEDEPVTFKGKKLHKDDKIEFDIYEDDFKEIATMIQENGKWILRADQTIKLEEKTK